MFPPPEALPRKSQMLILFLCLLALAALVALVDWRRGWLLAVVIGILQDPARKLTPGTPVEMTFSILAVYFAIQIGRAHV